MAVETLLALLFLVFAVPVATVVGLVLEGMRRGLRRRRIHRAAYSAVVTAVRD